MSSPVEVASDAFTLESAAHSTFGMPCFHFRSDGFPAAIQCEVVGAAVGAVGAAVGLLGAAVGLLGAEVGLLGAAVGLVGAEVGLVGAEVG